MTAVKSSACNTKELRASQASRKYLIPVMRFLSKEKKRKKEKKSEIIGEKKEKK